MASSGDTPPSRSLARMMSQGLTGVPCMLEDEVTDRDWQRLTLVRCKRDIMGVDPYFREAWAQAKRSWPGDPGILHQIGVIIFKPEAIAGRRMIPALEACASHGFVPVAFRRFRFDSRAMRELWRYQWNTVTVDRIRLATYLNSFCDSLMVVLNDHTDSVILPCTVRLSNLKGPCHPAFRNPRQLRSVMNSPNPVLAMIHTSDEPVDVLRDIGVIFGLDEIIGLYAEIRDHLQMDATERLVAEVESLHEGCPQHDLDPERACQRLIRRIRERATDHAVSRSECLELIDRLESAGNGSVVAWFDLEEGARNVGIRVDWDLVVAASTRIRAAFSDGRAIIEADGYSEWTRRDGTPVDDA